MARLPRIGERVVQQRRLNRDPAARVPRSAGGCEIETDRGEKQQQSQQGRQSSFGDGIDYAAAAGPNEMPSEARRRLLSLSAAEAVAASGRRFQQKKQEEQLRRHVRIKQEEERETIVISDSEEERETGEQELSHQDEQHIFRNTPVTTKVKFEPVNEDQEEEEEEEEVNEPEQRSAIDHLNRSMQVKNEVETSDVAPRTPSPPRAAREPAPMRERSDLSNSRGTEELVEKHILERNFPWPDHYLELERVFKALNTVYAFCSGRKHMATTYDTIKSSVENLLMRPLEIFDIAQIKSLCPDLINLAYVDQDMLQIHLDGGSSTASSAEGQGLTFRERARARQAYRDSIYEQTASAIGEGPDLSFMDEDGGTPAIDFSSNGGGWQDDFDEQQQQRQGPSQALTLEAPADVVAKRPAREKDEYVLLFEFNDGTLQGPKATARGRPGMRRGPSRKDQKPKVNPKLNDMPSPAAMRKLIEKRNFKFEQAVLELLSACRIKEEDPVQLLISAAEDHVPINPETAVVDGETPKKRRIRLEYLMNNPDERPSIIEVIEDLQGQAWYKNQIVPGGHRTVAERPARYEGLTFALSQELVNALWATRQIEEFYLHQAEALNALDDGKNIIVSTSTSSGKSLIYQIPVLRALEEDPTSTAMYIFPTKALAQDQKRTLQDLLMNCEGLEETIVATYDGDTDKDIRHDIRERASVIFTNPDMLHQSILPSENLWRRFLRGLRFVVVDELHMYNGLFGAHVSYVMRRLRRICAALGNRNVKFVSCSATVANPKEHMQTLFGVEDVEVVTEDGSPAGRKEWIVWNPPLIDDKDPKQGRVSAYAEVSRVFRHLLERGVRTIIFTKVRRTCEIVINQVRNDLLLQDRADIANKVMSYRSGYSPQDRRKIEQDMFKGQLLGIVATSALELGIDIGTLDAVIMLGFPYSISSLRQQAGRAGRRQKDSLALLVGDPFPMDQHYMQNPEEIFTQPDAELQVDLSNDFVLEGHLQCASAEMPIHPVEDSAFLGSSDTLEVLCRNRLVPTDDGFFHCRPELLPNPARDVALRGARQETYVYIDATPGRQNGARVMEEVEVDRAIFEAFEGAVFMHQGLSYICKDISHDTRIARMVQADVNFHTRPRDHTDTDAVETHRIRALRGTNSRAYYGHVRIETHVWGYFKVDRRANILDVVDVDCPPFIRNTVGLWMDVPLWLVEMLASKEINAAAAIHAAEHALLSLTPMFVVSLAGDVRTECKVAEREYSRKTTTRKRPARLIFYDAPGQNGGVCSKAFEHLDGLIRIAIAVIESCPCVEGCPSCVTSQTCAHANVVTSKVGALGVLRGLVGIEPFDENLAPQNEPGHRGVLTQATEDGDPDDALHRAAASQPSSSMALTMTHTLCEASPVRTQGGREIQVEHVEERLPPSLQRVLDRQGGDELVTRVNGPASTALPLPSNALSQSHRQRYAAPPLGKSMHYDEE